MVKQTKKKGGLARPHTVDGPSRKRTEKRGTARKASSSTVSKAVRGAVKGVKMANAFRTLINKTGKNAPGIMQKAVSGKGLTYPGTRYIGPGNKLNEGKPKSKADRAAYVHDHEYDQLLKKGVNPYTTFNRADRKMIKNADLTTDEGLALWLGMNAKRIFRRDSTELDKVEPWEAKYGKKKK